MSNLLHSNRDLSDLQPKNTFDDKDLNNEEKEHKDTKITKKKREKSVNMKVDMDDTIYFQFKVVENSKNKKSV